MASVTPNETATLNPTSDDIITAQQLEAAQASFKSVIGKFNEVIKQCLDDYWKNCLTGFTEDIKDAKGNILYTKEELYDALKTILGEITPKYHDTETLDEAKAIASTIFNRKTKIEEARSAFKEAEEAKAKAGGKWSEAFQRAKDKKNIAENYAPACKGKPVTITMIVTAGTYDGYQLGESYINKHETLIQQYQQNRCRIWKDIKTAVEELAKNPSKRNNYECFNKSKAKRKTPIGSGGNYFWDPETTGKRCDGKDVQIK